MGKFLKGHTTNVGKKKKPFSEATKLKMSLSKMGKKWTPETYEKMKNRIPWNKGKKSGQQMSVEAKDRLRLRMKGNQYTKDYRYPLEVRRKFGRQRELHHNWKGGLTTISEQIRKSIEYKLWRKAVFERDNYTCIWCGAKGNINADHIKRFSEYPELRFAIDNGRTLCIQCHRTTDTWGTKGLKLKAKGKK